MTQRKGAAKLDWMSFFWAVGKLVRFGCVWVPAREINSSKVIFGLARRILLDRDVLGNKKRENVLKGKNYFVGTNALQKMYIGGRSVRGPKCCGLLEILWVKPEFDPSIGLTTISPFRELPCCDHRYQCNIKLMQYWRVHASKCLIFCSKWNLSFFPKRTMRDALFGDVTETTDIVTLVVRNAVLSWGASLVVWFPVCSHISHEHQSGQTQIKVQADIGTS